MGHCNRYITILLLAVTMIGKATQVETATITLTQLGCKGQYNRTYLASLDGICKTCSHLYKEPELHRLCRSACFQNVYFSGCVQALMLEDKWGEYEMMVSKLSGN